MVLKRFDIICFVAPRLRRNVRPLLAAETFTLSCPCSRDDCLASPCDDGSDGDCDVVEFLTADLRCDLAGGDLQIDDAPLRTSLQQRRRSTVFRCSSQRVIASRLKRP